MRNARHHLTGLWRGLAACLLGTVVVLGSMGASVAEGGGIEPADYLKYQTRIIDGDESDREGALDELEGSPRVGHAQVYGGVLGPIFVQPERTKHLDEGRRRIVFASVILHLLHDQPEGDDAKPLFATDILKVLAADAQLVETLRRKLPRIRDRRPGWDRVLASAQEHLRDGDAAVRRAAIRISSQCECVDHADALASLHAALKEDAAGLTGEDAAAYLDAAEGLLLHRFPDVGALVKFLGDHAALFEGREGWSTADRERVRADLIAAVVLHIKAQGGEIESRARKTAVEFGQQLIEKASGPLDLLVFFDPTSDRFEELQRAAIAKARKLEPVANEAWAELLGSALRHSADPVVLEGAIALLSETFTRRGKEWQLLAGAVADRIAREDGRDSVEHREKLATNLGRIGNLGDVQRALGEGRFLDENDPQSAVWARLIRAVGLVDDGLVAFLRLYYVQNGNVRPATWARRAVAQALGQKGFHGDSLQAPQAALFLRHILTGEPGKAVEVQVQVDGKPTKAILIFIGEERLASEEARKALETGDNIPLSLTRAQDLEGGDRSDEVRVAAIRSLEFYARAETAEVLGSAAAEDSQAGAEALKVLGRQLGRGNDEAASALQRLIKSSPPEARLLAALDAIAEAPRPASAVARNLLGKAVRTVLQGQAPDGVRRKAAAVAAHLAYAGALQPVFLAWKARKAEDEGRKVWFGLLQQLAVAVARAGAKSLQVDQELAGALREMATVDTVADVLALFEAMGQDAERFDLKRLEADLTWEFSQVPEGGTRDQRRARLDAAITMYAELVQVGEANVQGGLYESLYNFLRERSKAEWLAEGETAALFQLRAVTAAADSKIERVAKEALEQIVPALEQATLEAPQKAALAADIARLEAITGG